MADTRATTHLLEVYAQQRSALRRYLCARFQDEALADDVLQDMYLKLSRLSLLNAVTNPEAYLYRMANRQALDQRKREGRQQARDHAWFTHHARLAAGNVQAEEDAASARQQALKAALDEVPTKARAVFIAHKIDGLPHKMIADRMGISTSTVEKHIRRAYRQLLNLLNPEGEAPKPPDKPPPTPPD